MLLSYYLRHYSLGGRASQADEVHKLKPSGGVVRIWYTPWTLLSWSTTIETRTATTSVEEFGSQQLGVVEFSYHGSLLTRSDGGRRQNFLRSGAESHYHRTPGSSFGLLTPATFKVLGFVVGSIQGSVWESMRVRIGVLSGLPCCPVVE